MNNSIPRINEDKIIRHIDEGDKHILVPKLILNQKNINLNVSAYLMYSAVDGKKNINELCDEMLKTFRGVTKDNLVNDVMDFYMSLWKIGILSWDVNPYPEKYSKHIGNWFIRYISTDDVKEYSRICDKSTEEYINPYRYKDQLTGVDNMLQSIVNNAMFCFAVTHEDRDAAVFEIHVNLREMTFTLDHMAVINREVCKLTKEEIKEILGWSRQLITELLKVYRPKKIRVMNWEIVVKDKSNAFLQSCIDIMGYNYKTTLEYETIDGEVVVYYFANR